MRDRRRGLTAEQRQQAAQGLLGQLQNIDDIDSAKSIAMYLENDGEIDPVLFMQWCWDKAKLTYVPIVVQHGSNRLLFAPVHANTRFQKNRFQIDEPVVQNEELIQASELDLVLMPLVSFDQSGNRVGMGGGFYDTTFEFVKSNQCARPVLVGIAHELQKVERIDAESWDIPLHRVVTDRQVYHL